MDKAANAKAGASGVEAGAEAEAGTEDAAVDANKALQIAEKEMERTKAMAVRRARKLFRCNGSTMNQTNEHETDNAPT